MEVLPSPNFQDHLFILPELTLEESINKTAAGAHTLVKENAAAVVTDGTMMEIESLFGIGHLLSE